MEERLTVNGKSSRLKNCSARARAGIPILSVRAVKGTCLNKFTTSLARTTISAIS